MGKFQLKETMWVCVLGDYALKSTQQELRKDSIAKLIEDLPYSWNQYKSYGWRCIKVEVITTEIKSLNKNNNQPNEQH